MKTYLTRVHTPELAAYLCVNGVPFNFDGFLIQFMASKDFIRDMQKSNPVLAVISFKERNL